MNIHPTPTDWLMMLSVGVLVFIATYMAGNHPPPAADAVAAYVARF